MKKLITLCLTLIALNAQAKKVQFNVDMRYQTIDAFGVHVSGDFLTALGYSANWLSDSVQLTQVGTSTVYSIVVDLPAFKAYEYYYLNGKETYQVEFIPYESQVIHNFATNRWIYIDSTANDTTILPAVIFSTNAPFGKTLIRHRVDMQNVSTIHPNGVHLATDGDNFDYNTKRMYSFDNKVYEHLTYVDSAVPSTQKFIFANGNTSTQAEVATANCFVGGKRSATTSVDVILPTVCYNACVACIPASTSNVTKANIISIGTNPVNNKLLIINSSNQKTHYSIYNIYGQLMQVFSNNTNEQYIDVSQYAAGNYMLVYHTNKAHNVINWIKQ